MSELVGDRFVRAGASWIDLATGQGVRLHLGPAGTRQQQLVWDDRCASLSRLRHPLVNPLLDYGPVGLQRTFEAYAVTREIATSGRIGCELLTHAVRFLSSQGLPLTHDQADRTLRAASRRPSAGGGRPIGVVLQPRRAVARLREVLNDVARGGPITIAVHGAPGSGMRTLRQMVARAARLAGFVPIDAGLIGRCLDVPALVRDRHVCLLYDLPGRGAEARSISGFLTALGRASARGHVVVQFSRAAVPGADGCLEIDPMGVTALSTMAFVDPDFGPSPHDVWNAARQADGSPGRFLKWLQAVPYPDGRPAAFVVHETSPPYVVDPPRDDARAGRRGQRRHLAAAVERAERMVARGRHASAVRLLARASRVLDARGEPGMASRCTQVLAWTLRNRGGSAAAAGHFARAAARAPDETERLQSCVGLAIAWTDMGRPQEAEASLRGALAGVTLIEARGLETTIRRALARSLHWQHRHDEALIVLQRPADSCADVETVALMARLHTALGEHRRALAVAADAGRRATTARERAQAWRAIAIAQHATGDIEAARASAHAGLNEAIRGRLPLLALRLRTSLLAWSRPEPDERPGGLVVWARMALRRAIPPLHREHLQQALAAATSVGPPSPPDHPALTQLRTLLELAHGAADDRSAAERIANDLLERLRAATVLIVAVSAPFEPLVRAGRPWPDEPRIAARVLAGGREVVHDIDAGSAETAAVIRYGNDAIGAVACRWTVGACVDAARAAATLGAAALAVAPAVRGLLDRRQARLPENRRDDLIGSSPPMTSLREAVARAARAPFPVLVEGESGSGKELVARALHRLGPRRDRRLCAVNCAALADDLLEAELFGHARGAYTGAVGERAGLFEEADGGTLFLDEIGELSPRAQAKLLRVLQDGEVRRVGENLPRRVDARVVAATNRSLEDEAEAGRFRADLRYRLDVIRIRVPPLRERATDIPQLAIHFWDDAMRRLGSSATLAPETLAALARYDWPGNVRELQNAIASMAVHAPRRGRVTSGVLPLHIARVPERAGMTFEAARVDFERRFVAAALARAGGRRTRAARLLGITRQGLSKMMRRLGIDEAGLQA